MEEVEETGTPLGVPPAVSPAVGSADDVELGEEEEEPASMDQRMALLLDTIEHLSEHLQLDGQLRGLQEVHGALRAKLQSDEHGRVSSAAQAVRAGHMQARSMHGMGCAQWAKSMCI